MNKNTGAFFTMFASILLCATGEVKADIQSNNAFLYGDNIEVGIGTDGAFGSEKKSKQGLSSNSFLGVIMPLDSMNTYDNTYNGDFIVSNGPADEEGWGVSFDGKTYNNNNAIEEPQISGTFSDFKISRNTQSVTWKGAIYGLEITQTYRIYQTGTALVFDVTLKNTSDAEIKEVYYMRTINPENNVEFNGDYKTINTIESQGGDGGGISTVSAKQQNGTADGETYAESKISLSGYGDNSHVTYGGIKNRDPAAVYTGSDLLLKDELGSSENSDKSLSIAFKFDQILPGETVSLRAGYQLADLPVAIIDIDDDGSSGATGNGYQQLYILGSAASKITDTDISINGNGATKLNEAIITITNPHEGDLLSISGTLPEGITLDTVSAKDSEIKLTGAASIADYQAALAQIEFVNTNVNTSIETRKITLQVIDENDTPSNAATSTVDITTPVELDNPKIASDDAINAEEAGNVGFSGHAAPNAEVKVDFTDKNSNKLTPAKTVTADDNGNWSIASDPADLSSLSDGPIAIKVTAIDPNGNTATLDKDIIKDTAIILSNITPINNAVVSTMTPTYKGDSDPEAMIVLKILPDGKIYNTQADADGKWSIKLDQFAMGVTQNVEIIAEDEYENSTKQTLVFTTPSLPIDVTDLDADLNGLAHTKTPILKGTSNPNTSITISMPTANSQPSSCSTTTDSDGNWVCQLSVSPSGGPYTLTVTTTDNKGNQNSTTRELSIPDLSLVISSPEDNQRVSTTMPTFTGTTDPNATLTLEVLPAGKTYTTTADAEGNWSIDLDDSLPKGETVSVKVTAKDDAGNEKSLIQHVQTPTLLLDVVDLGVNAQGMADSTSPVIKGTSEPGTNIQLNMPTSNGQVSSCNTATDAEGNWECELPVSPSGGPYTLTVTTTDSEGNSNSVEKQISIPKLPLIIDSPANNAVISGVNPVITGTSKPDSKIKILVDNGSSCNAVTDATNHWSCQLPDLAFEQNYSLTVTSEDGFGNKTTKTVDISTDKLPLAIVTPQDNSTAEDTTPRFIGTTTANTQVTVTMASGESCTAQADSDGKWSCELPIVSVGGPYAVTIKAVDSHGNQTMLTENITIPATPLRITAPTEGDVIKASNVTVTGTSDPSSPIVVLGPDGEKCETTADATGSWSCELKNLQAGVGKHITVISGDNQKVAIRTIDIENSSEKVKTVLSGSPSGILLVLFGLLLFLKRNQTILFKRLEE